MFEWIMDNTWSLWITIALVCIILETLSTDLLWLMVAGGATAAFVAALMGVPFAVEMGIFAVVAFVLVWALRPIALRHMTVSPEDGKDIGINSYPGEIADVTEDITDTAGLVRFKSNNWTARLSSGTGPVPAGSQVVIDEVDGAILRVSPVPPHRQLPPSH